MRLAIRGQSRNFPFVLMCSKPTDFGDVGIIIANGMVTVHSMEQFKVSTFHPVDPGTEAIPTT